MAIVRRNDPRDLSTWNAWSVLPTRFSDLRREVDQMFDRFLGSPELETSLGTSPPVNIVERQNEYLVTAELPGVRMEDIKITLQNDVLTIRGEKQHEQHEDTDTYHRSEITSGSFQRSFALPSAVRSDQIEATSDNGVLTIRIPKAEEAKPREIEIKHGSAGSTSEKSGTNPNNRAQ